MPTIVVRHKVGDFNTWLSGHQDRVNVLSTIGSGFTTFQDADDPNSIVLVLDVTDIEKFGEVMNDPDITQMRIRHTVLDPVVVSMQVDV